jgi:hypothetical protein
MFPIAFLALAPAPPLSRPPDRPAKPLEPDPLSCPVTIVARDDVVPRTKITPQPPACPTRGAFHDREGFSTPCGTKPFAIIENRFEIVRLP